MLTLLPLFGEVHATRVTLSREDQKSLEFLNKSLSSSKYSTNKPTYLSWMKSFEEGGGGTDSSKSRLAYWLSYFVFSSSLRIGSTIIYSHSPFCLPKEVDWHWCPCTWTIYKRGSMNAL